MSTPRVPCKNPNCANTILPATATANDGLCAPCVGAIACAEHAEYVRKNRRTVDLYKGVTDPAEIACIMLRSREFDELIEYAPPPFDKETLFSGLAPAHHHRLTSIAIKEKKRKNGDSEFAEEIAKSLAALTTARLDDLLAAWLDARDAWPPFIFRNAGAGIRDRLLALLSSGEIEVDFGVRALAWVGGEEVTHLFSKWNASPPFWLTGRDTNLAGFAREAGWEVSAGKRRDLYSHDCFAFEPAGGGVEDIGLQIMTGAPGHCPWCARKLIHLIEIPLLHPSLGFLGWPGERLPLLACERCTGYTKHTFARISADNTAVWHPANVRPAHNGKDEDWTDDPSNVPPLKLRPRLATAAADWLMEIPASQIGGMPTWINDDGAYPQCPGCSTTMMFLAQVDNEQFDDGEGIFYAFGCASCRITATAFQSS